MTKPEQIFVRIDDPPLYGPNYAEWERHLAALESLPLLLSLSVSAQAQTKGNQLRGVSQFRIVIDPLDSHSARCGVTEEGIRRAILYPASSAEFKISEDGLTWLNVNVATLDSGSPDLCATHNQMQAVGFQKVMLQASGREVFSRIELWSDGRMGVSQRREHQRGVEQAIEDSTKQFITDWNMDNK